MNLNTIAALPLFGPALQTNPVLEAIKQAIQSVIKANGFSVLTTYPIDLDVAMTQIQAVIGANCKVAFIIGDSHIHSILLNVHQEDNDLVHHLLRLSSSDQYYILELEQNGAFELLNIGREEMQRYPSSCHYTTKGHDNLRFALVKHQQALVDIHIESSGTIHERSFTIKLKPLTSISIVDRRAAETYAIKSIGRHIGTLFFQSIFQWIEQ